ncbi:hypothetical protein K7X08_018279 [Anisodus acutangulus]|uniref:Uncharacterized protein n=1 Tax=Anisodus acutangulus TaxID=402998 RepID=A0A9Q1LXF4_9SOLA|nr:hypothetical protein K7X08_018279 [Anisodus acutangulus]
MFGNCNSCESTLRGWSCGSRRRANTNGIGVTNFNFHFSRFNLTHKIDHGVELTMALERCSQLSQLGGGQKKSVGNMPLAQEMRSPCEIPQLTSCERTLLGWSCGYPRRTNSIGVTNLSGSFRYESRCKGAKNKPCFIGQLGPKSFPLFNFLLGMGGQGPKWQKERGDMVRKSHFYNVAAIK